MTLTLPQIITIILVLAGLVLAMRLIRPKLSISEQYLLREIQQKSPQSDNIRLYMWIKMVVHPVDEGSDLNYQQEYLNDPAGYKQLVEQFYGFGPNALYPLLGYETLTWKLDPKTPNPLIVRLAASIVCRRFPHSAAVIEDLIIQSPDAATQKFLSKHPQDFEHTTESHSRYGMTLLNILQLITTTARNDWWPGVSPDIREWAENTFKKLPKHFKDIDVIEPTDG